MRNPNARVSDPNSFVTSSGDRYHIEYSPIVRDDGTILLKESGKVDIQEMIDSYREQTDMSFILKRMALGDTSVLTQKEAMFGDFTSMPKSYAEALQLVIDSEAKFMKLPLDVRNAFDNDFRKWFATSGNADWYEKMSPVIPKDESVNDEVQSDES